MLAIVLTRLKTESRMYTDRAQLLVLVLCLQKSNLTGGTFGKVVRAPHSSRMEELLVATVLLLSTACSRPAAPTTATPSAPRSCC